MPCWAIPRGWANPFSAAPGAGSQDNRPPWQWDLAQTVGFAWRSPACGGGFLRFLPSLGPERAHAPPSRRRFSFGMPCPLAPGVKGLTAPTPPGDADRLLHRITSAPSSRRADRSRVAVPHSAAQGAARRESRTADHHGAGWRLFAGQGANAARPRECVRERVSATIAVGGVPVVFWAEMGVGTLLDYGHPHVYDCG